jgi:hypothetical protein
MFYILSTFFFLAIVFGAVVSSTRSLRGTTIRVASWWALAGVTSWLIATVAAMFVVQQAGWVDTAHYVIAVVLLCPLIAVLGARRPSANVWNLFVLVPLILVLMWPVVASSDVLKGRPLELESPSIVAFCLVLVMGAGNYFGTLSGLPAFLFACSQVCLVLPLWGHVPDFFPDTQTARLVASFGVAWGIWLVKRRRIASRNWEGPALTKLWLDFIDTYGMVWGKRVMDRVNEAAVHEDWSCRLELDGFSNADKSVDNDPQTPDAESLRQAEPIIRWLMKRFVDEAWVIDRIGVADPDLPTLGNTNIPSAD